MKNLIYIAIFFLLNSCVVEIQFINYLSKKQKEFLLYKEKETFSILKNKTDTIDFEVTNVIFSENEESGLRSYEYGVLSFNRISLTKSNYWGKIQIEAKDNCYSINFQGKYFAYNNSRSENKQKIVTTDLIFIGDTTLNNKAYHNVYFIYDKQDTLYFSKEKGIIYIKLSAKNETYK